MGKKSTCVYSVLTIIQFIVIAVGLGYSAYLLAQIPTADNTLSIICVAFTSFAMLTTLTGGMGNCTKSRWLLKCSGLMGIVCIVTFIIIAVFSGLWYGGIQVIPKVAFGNRNITELCKDYPTGNQTEITTIQDQTNDTVTAAAQIQDANITTTTTTSPSTTEQPITTNDTNATTVITPTTQTSTTNSTADTEDDDEPLSFTEKRLLYAYCGVSGWMRDLVFGNNDESIGSQVYMLAVLIVSCVLTLLYLISTCLSFHMARRVQNAQFNSWN